MWRGVVTLALTAIIDGCQVLLHSELGARSHLLFLIPSLIFGRTALCAYRLHDTIARIARELDAMAYNCTEAWGKSSTYVCGEIISSES